MTDRDDYTEVLRVAEQFESVGYDCSCNTHKIARALLALHAERDKLREELRLWAIGLGPGPQRMKELRDEHRALGENL